MKIKIGRMPYLNSDIFYLEKIKTFDYIDLTPKKMGEAFRDGLINSGPLSMIDYFQENQIEPVSNFCVSTKNLARSVLLFSNKDLRDIESVYITEETSTSVNLLKVLNKFFWKNKKIKFTNDKKVSESFLYIGDKAISMKQDKLAKFESTFDLGEEWNKYTSLPFVFARWGSRNLNPKDKDRLINVLEKQINNFENNLIKIGQSRSTAIFSQDKIEEYLKGFNYKINYPEKLSINLFKELYNKLDDHY